MSSGFQVGQQVKSSEHLAQTIGTIVDAKPGFLTIQWVTPISSEFPYGHTCVEMWPESDWHLLECFY